MLFLVFISLESLSKIQELGNQPKSQIGKAQENVHKNRFPDIIPLDAYIPILTSKGVTHGSNDYINATKLQDDGSILLTQDPLVSIVEDFWRLVYDYKCSTIIMLNDGNTTDKTAVKYWPDAGTTVYASITVKCISTSRDNDFRMQQFEVTHQDHEEMVSVKHMTFDRSEKDDDILPKMVDFIKITGNTASGPTVIHCLNGVGLSAVYVIVKSLIESLEKEGTCDLFLAVQRLRKKNHNFILSKDDYALCLKLLRSYLNNEDDYSVIY